MAVLNKVFDEIIIIINSLLVQVKTTGVYYQSSDENFINFFITLSGEKHVNKSNYLVLQKRNPEFITRYRKIVDSMMIAIDDFLTKLIFRCKAAKSLKNLNDAQMQKFFDSVAEDIRVRFKILKIDEFLRKTQGDHRRNPKDDQICKLYDLLDAHKSETQFIIERLFAYRKQDDIEEDFEELNKTLEKEAIRKAIARSRNYRDKILFDLKSLEEKHPTIENALSETKAIIDSNESKFLDPERTGLITYEIKIALSQSYLELSALDQNVTIWCKERKRQIKTKQKQESRLRDEEDTKAFMLAREAAAKQAPSLEDLAEDQEVENLLETICEQNQTAQAKKAAIKAAKRTEFAKQLLTVVSETNNVEQQHQEEPATKSEIILNSDQYHLLEFIFDDKAPKNGVINFSKILLLTKNCDAVIEQNGTSHVTFRFVNENGKGSCTIPRHNHHGHGRNKVMGIYIKLLKEALVSAGITPETVTPKAELTSSPKSVTAMCAR